MERASQRLYLLQHHKFQKMVAHSVLTNSKFICGDKNNIFCDLLGAGLASTGDKPLLKNADLVYSKLWHKLANLHPNFPVIMLDFSILLLLEEKISGPPPIR